MGGGQTWATNKIAGVRKRKAAEAAVASRLAAEASGSVEVVDGGSGEEGFAGDG